ncbi:DUF1349 domain-containing protein [Bifidobacterium tsurumiense]|uniref:DUF1349 domain-containing protein n=1 Tax=Bifidobacterium tsurumiense TaxID=356829 RepID=UPI0018A6B319|nr:DUF1349 domain-containing protein [Bifidobacterium tsurumiense]
MSGVNFRAPADSWRTTAAFADLVQVSGNKGKVTIETCNFGHAHDDPINIHGTYLVMTTKNGNTATSSYKHNETAGFPQLYPSDEVALVDRSTMLDTGWQSKVVSVDGPDERSHNRSLTDITVTFDRDLPEDAQINNVAADNLTHQPEVVVRDNHFESIPTRGLLVTTRGKVLIEDNVFDNMWISSIYISGDSNSWLESSMSRDVTIRGNTFIRPSYYAGNPMPTIWFDPTADGNDPAQAEHHNVTIENNTFPIGQASILTAKNVADTTFSNNMNRKYDASSSLTTTASLETMPVGSSTTLKVTDQGTQGSRTLFTLQGSRNITFSDNAHDAGLNRVVRTNNSDDATVNAEDSLVVNGDHPADANNSVRWVLSDPSLASISEEGVLQALAAGTVAVRPIYDTGNGIIVGDPVAVTITESGNDVPTNPIDAIRPTQDSWTDGDALVVRSASNTSLWARSTPPNNLQAVRNVSLAQGESVTVRMEGKTQDFYEEVGMLLYADDDNYIASQRKHNNGRPTITVVTERNASPEESRKVSGPDAQAIWLRLSRGDQGMQASWSQDGATFQDIGSPVNIPAIADAGRVVLMATGHRGSNQNPPTYRFSDLKVGDRGVALVGGQAPDAAQVAWAEESLEEVDREASGRNANLSSAVVEVQISVPPMLIFLDKRHLWACWIHRLQSSRSLRWLLPMVQWFVRGSTGLGSNRQKPGRSPCRLLVASM